VRHPSLDDRLDPALRIDEVSVAAIEPTERYA
jgi:hypothetical protein